MNKVLFAFVLFAAPLTGAERFDVRANYTKFECRIPMRDGTRLFTSVYVPKDASERHPFLLTRTPYGVGPYGPDAYRRSLGPSETFARSGYIFVYQDVRGRGLSEGIWREMTPELDRPASKAGVDESTDAYDTVDWLLAHVPGNSGKVGILGISYPGFYAAAGIIDTHPAIRAASPQAPIIDLYHGDDSYHNGAFMLAANFDFYTSFRPQKAPGVPGEPQAPFDYGTRDGYAFYLKLGAVANADRRYFRGRNPLWTDQVEHVTWDDYWRARDLAPHLRGIRCPVLVVGGWFDAEDLAGTLSAYRTIRRNNPGVFDALVMGPWIHGGWAEGAGRRVGPVEFGSDTAVFFRERILYPFFEEALKGQGDAVLPGATVFETGANAWRSYPSWPPPGAAGRTLYFRAGGGLAFDPPPGGTAYDSYVSNPRKPVPFLDSPAEAVPPEYMVADQRFASRRPDVVAYETGPLAGDVTAAGPVSPRLYVSTSGTDSDWVVKLIDVYPPGGAMGGYEQLVRGEPFRGRYRRGFERPEPMVPGRVEEIAFTMPDVNHTFRKGHRIMVQVQSSWFPLVDRNPQTFVNIPHAEPADFRKAEERVYRSASRPSGISIDVLPGR